MKKKEYCKINVNVDSEKRVLEHTKRFYNMRCPVMFETAVCLIFINKAVKPVDDY